MHRLHENPSRHRTWTPWQDACLLLIAFCLWKFILFSIVVLAPGPGYDTSSSLLVDLKGQDLVSGGVCDISAGLAPAMKFVRWDAVYFSQIIRRGYIFEQEWAFGSGFPALVAFIKKGTDSRERQRRLVSLQNRQFKGRVL